MRTACVKPTLTTGVCGASSRNKVRRERGSVFVEFSLVLIPLLAVMFLTIDLAWILFGWASLQEGVREGVRWGVTGEILAPNTGLDASIKQMVQMCSFGFLNSNNSPTITVQYFTPLNLQNVTGQGGATVGGNIVKVTASMSLPLLISIWHNNGTAAGTFSNWTIHLTAASSDVMESAPGGVTPPE